MFGVCSPLLLYRQLPSWRAFPSCVTRQLGSWRYIGFASFGIGADGAGDICRLRLLMCLRVAFAVALSLEAAAAHALQRATRRDGGSIWPVDRRAQRQIVRWDDAPDGAAEAALELVDAVEFLPWLQNVGDGAPVVVGRAMRLDPAHALPLQQVVGA